MDIAQHLHWTLAWVLLPLAALVAAGGALRTDLARPWRQLLTCAAGGVTMVLMLRAARHGLGQWPVPLYVWLGAPVVLALLAVVALAASRALFVVFALLALVALHGWIVLIALWLGGLDGLHRLHDALFFITLPMLVAGLWKQLRTPVPEPPPPPPSPPSVPREELLQQRLDSAEAQEAADKYTRD